MNRKQAAKRLGLAVRTLRDLEERGELVPIGAKGNERLYTEAIVVAFEQRRQIAREIEAVKEGARRKPLPPHEGEIAARVFEMLEQKRSRIEIVIELRVDPERVDELAKHYQKMRAERGDATQACAGCKRTPARFCGECLTTRRAS